MSNTKSLEKEWLEQLPARLQESPELGNLAVEHLIRLLPLSVIELMPLDKSCIGFEQSPDIAEPVRPAALWLNYFYGDGDALLAQRKNYPALEFLLETLHKLTGVKQIVLMGNDGRWIAELSPKIMPSTSEKFSLWFW